MSKTKLLLDVVENLRNLVNSIQDLHDVMIEPPNAETTGVLEEKNINKEKSKFHLKKYVACLTKSRRKANLQKCER